jgi:lipoprotein-anchoring transpeptidase ErfK/SrfK
MTHKLDYETQEHLNIDIARQQLSIIKLGNKVLSYPVSTAKNGSGELKGSECTPRGWHSIRAKIGENQALHTVFIGRRPTGEIYSPVLATLHPQRDWILTRILWLGGLEPHKNRYGNVDSTWRYIYIHGCPDDSVTGSPQSHGCIRMKNADLLDLFNRIDVGIKVYIHE